MSVTITSPVLQGNKFVCHLEATTEKELLRMAERLGLRVSFVGQAKGTVDHVDIPNQHKYKLALQYGAFPLLGKGA